VRPGESCVHPFFLSFSSFLEADREDIMFIYLIINESLSPPGASKERMEMKQEKG
jgi:hypothetical protein